MIGSKRDSLITLYLSKHEAGLLSKGPISGELVTMNQGKCVFSEVEIEVDKRLEAPFEVLCDEFNNYVVTISGVTHDNVYRNGINPNKGSKNCKNSLALMTNRYANDDFKQSLNLKLLKSVLETK
ncbi:MAG: hypothetical protein JW700_03375 [Candidatus Aenigmarchaeota archaeon]|nr:hypothetical protein [Candidatus Aenigmarchaeota archaeon]